MDKQTEDKMITSYYRDGERILGGDRNAGRLLTRLKESKGLAGAALLLLHGYLRVQSGELHDLKAWLGKIAAAEKKTAPVNGKIPDNYLWMTRPEIHRFDDLWGAGKYSEAYKHREQCWARRT